MSKKSEAQKFVDKIEKAKKAGVDKVYIVVRKGNYSHIDRLVLYKMEEISEDGVIKFGYGETDFKYIDPAEIFSISPIGESIL